MVFFKKVIVSISARCHYFVQNMHSSDSTLFLFPFTRTVRDSSLYRISFPLVLVRLNITLKFVSKDYLLCSHAEGHLKSRPKSSGFLTVKAVSRHALVCSD